MGTGRIEDEAGDRSFSVDVTEALSQKP